MLHSENETDVAERHVRACSLDMLIDVIPAGDQPVAERHPETAEGDFLHLVGDALVRLGSLDQHDLDNLERKMSACPFIIGLSKSDPDAAIPNSVSQNVPSLAGSEDRGATSRSSMSNPEASAI